MKVRLELIYETDPDPKSFKQVEQVINGLIIAYDLKGDRTFLEFNVKNVSCKIEEVK